MSRKPRKRKVKGVPGAIVPQSARAVLAGVPVSVVAETPAETLEAAILRVVDRIGRHELVTAACTAEGVDSTSLYDWRDASDENARRYARARAAQARGLADEVVTVARRKPLDMVDVVQMKLEADALKWYVGKVLPAEFGDRIAVDGAVTHRVFVDFDELSAPASCASPAPDVSSAGS